MEELFPFSVWKQAAGQQQVSLVLVVRPPGQPPFRSANHQSINSYCPDHILSSVQINHGAVSCFIHFIFSSCFCASHFFSFLEIFLRLRKTISPATRRSRQRRIVSNCIAMLQLSNSNHLFTCDSVCTIFTRHRTSQEIIIIIE